MLQIKKKTANYWEYKVGNNVNIANLVVFFENPECNNDKRPLQKLNNGGSLNEAVPK